MKLPWLAERVVLACKELTPAQKLLWMQYRQLDQGEAGAFIGETALAERLGMGADNLKKCRTALVEAGLLRMVRTGHRRTASWFLVWPDTLPLPAAGRVDPVAIVAFAVDLGGWIRLAREGSTPVHPSEGADQSERVYPSTPFAEKGCTPVHPKGVPQYTQKGVPQYTQSSKRRVGAEHERGSSVSRGKVLNPPTSAAPLATLGRGSRERSDEHGDQHHRPGPEHIGTILRRQA